jgi:hypothetical protein
LRNYYFGKIALCQATMAEAISLAGQLNDMHALAHALNWAAILGQAERNPAEVERLASDLIELSTRHSFSYWLTAGTMFRGWARSASGDTVEGIPLIEHGIRDLRATGTVTGLPFWLAVKAEALHLADRSSEALEAISEAEALAEKFEQRVNCAELHRLRGVFLTAMGAEETQIEASFGEAIRIAKEQKGGFARETRSSNLRRISQIKSECVRRTWIPTNSLLTSGSALPFVEGFPNFITTTSACTARFR